MKLKTKSYNVKKLLEYKSNSYKRKYFILSSLFKSNITESNRLYEEFICYTDALNYSNGMYPNENDLINFYKECMKYSNYSDQIVETKTNFIENYNNLRNPNLKNDLINEALDSIRFSNKKIDKKLKEVLTQSIINKSPILVESAYSESYLYSDNTLNKDLKLFVNEMSYTKDNIVDLTNLFSDPDETQLSAISSEDFDENEMSEPQFIDKMSHKIIDIFKPITGGKDPKNVSKKELAKMMGFVGNGKYKPGQVGPVLSGWDVLEMNMLRKMSPYGRQGENGFSTSAQRKWWIIETIKFCLAMEKQSKFFLGISDSEKSNFARMDLDSQEKQAAATSLAKSRQSAGFGRNVSDEEIRQITNDLQSCLQRGKFDLEDVAITETELFRLLRRASIARPEGIQYFKNVLEMMYPLAPVGADFNRVPIQSDEERSQTQDEIEDYRSMKDKETSAIYGDEIDPETGEPLYADEKTIADINANKNVIKTKDIVDSTNQESTQMTVKDFNEFMSDLEKDMLRLKELTEKSADRVNPDIFKPFETDNKGNITPDINLVPDVIPAETLSAEEIKEIEDILIKMSKAKNITILNYDKRGDVYNQLIDNAVSVDEYRAFMKSFNLDNIDEPVSWRDIARSSYGKLKDTAGARQMGVKAWMKELFYSSSADEKADIYANAAELWIERLTKLDLIDDKAFTRMKSKTGVDADDKAIPASVLQDLEDQGKYKRSQKLKDISKTLETVTKYATSPKFVKRYFDMNREDNLEQAVSEKMNSLQNIASSEDEYDALLARLESEDKDVAAYAILDSMFTGDSGFRIFVTGLLKEYYNEISWPAIEVDLAHAVKDYFKVNYPGSNIGTSLSLEKGASEVKKEEGKELFNKIIYLVMERTGIKSSDTRVPTVGDSIEQRKNYAKGLADPRGDFAKAVEKFNLKFRSGDNFKNRIVGKGGGVFNKNDVDMLLDDIFSDTGIIGKPYSDFKRLNQTTAAEIIAWLQSYPEAKLDEAIILGMSLSDAYRRTDADKLRTDFIEMIGKDTKKALADYKKQYGGSLVGKDFAEYLDDYFGYDETIDLKAKGSSNPGGKNFQ